MPRRRAVFAVVALALSALAAAPQPSPQKSEKAPAQPSASFLAGRQAFSLGLYGKLAVRKGSLFFSPYSLSTALGMTWAGARGATADEMAKALRFGDDTHAGFEALSQRLSGKQPGYQLSVANRLFVQQGFGLAGLFSTLTKEKYDAAAESVDFTKPATRTHINGWVEQQTHQRIKELIPEGTLTGATRLVLVNAIYFKGTWATAFDKQATKPAPFLGGEKAAEVPLMFTPSSAGPACGTPKRPTCRRWSCRTKAAT